MSTQSTTYTGVPVSPGSAVGPVVQVARPVAAPDDEPAPQDVETARRQVHSAFDEVAANLDRRAAAAPKTGRDILTATAMMARDNALLTSVDQRIDSGSGPTTAVRDSVAEYATAFEAAGGYLAERVTDLVDVRDRVTAHLLGLPAPGVPALERPSVLVAVDLAPAETATLDPTQVLGIVTESGGRGSHTAILAAQLGIPAVVQVSGATALESGTTVAVDGDSGTVTADPDQQTRDALRDRAAARRDALAGVSGPGRTADGHQVALLANIGSADDAVTAGRMDLEGVGLFRTEVLFLGRRSAPTREEQTAIYHQVFEAFPGRKVVVRTLDAGADKPLAFADLGAEDNPALGRRGLRMSQAVPDLLDTQLAALADAARDCEADVQVMAPMVATAGEAAWFAERAHAAGLDTSGVMIEVPAAALRARDVLSPVEFGSLGTNDLAQYTMAADRTHNALSDLLDPWHPALLDVIACACAGAADAGRPLGVCGESAGDPLLALVLTGLGVTSLSMAPGKVDLVRFALRAHDRGACEHLAEAARAATDAQTARRAVYDEVDQSLRALL